MKGEDPNKTSHNKTLNETETMTDHFILSSQVNGVFIYYFKMFWFRFIISSNIFMICDII